MIESTEDNLTQPIPDETGDVSQTTLQSINLNNNEERADGEHDNVDGTGNEEKSDDKNGALDDKCVESSNNLEIDKNTVYDSDAMEAHLGKDGTIGDEAEVTHIDEAIINSCHEDKKQLDSVEETLKDDVTIDKSTYEKMLSDQKRLQDELKRLKEHLIMVEDDYTSEILELETREAVVKNELNQALESISQLKASQTGFSHDPNFSEQLEKLKEERDRALDDVSKLDDKVHSLTASVTNLQLVIEQIQKENEKKIKSLAKQHEAAIESERAIQNELRQEIEIYEKRIIEASQALQAATRLTENIDNKEKIIQNLKQELNDKDHHISKLEIDIANLKTSFEGKVDKQVIKNLILGYFGTPNDKKHEVERLLARVLDFNEEEMSRAGLSFGRQPNKFTVGPINPANSSDKVKSTATGSVLLAPSQKLPVSNSAIASPGSSGLHQSSSQETNPDSLSKMFVEFLEAESRPKGGVANSSVSPLTRELARDFTKVALNSSTKNNLLESTLNGKNKMSPIAITSSSSSSSSTTTATNTSSLPFSSKSSFSSLVTTRGLQQTPNGILSTNSKLLNPILAPASSFASNKLGNNFSGSSHSPIRPITINSTNLLDHDQSTNTDFSTSTSSSSSSILKSIPSLNTLIKPTNFESNQIVSLSSPSSSTLD
ncbi:thyroid receptor-interacting protein 11-like [Tetranychus urticae]|uniref:GRIP domain-containing protein n=1 Tax=Tetranychus urticae TaxID=32264 RepID=T1L1R6_TETUR|nr:thyroid receptor-interacting protein 11-like [Tetranychus urticae]